MQHEGTAKKHESSASFAQQASELDALYDAQTPLPAIVQRVHTDPRGLKPRDVMRLQRTLGNQAVSRLLTTPTPSQPVKETAPDNHVQRVIIELLNDEGKPIKKQWNAYSQRIATNWGINEMVARPIVAHLIENLNEQNQLDTLANSTRVTKAIYDKYKDTVYYLYTLVARGATRRDLEVALLLDGEHGGVTAANLDWFQQTHPANVQLVWSEWFKYTHNNEWDPPTYDAEIAVTIGKSQWGYIHIHYPRDIEAADIDTGAINAIHIKKWKMDTTKSALANPWKQICQDIVDQHINERPVPQVQVV